MRLAGKLQTDGGQEWEQALQESLAAFQRASLLRPDNQNVLANLKELHDIMHRAGLQFAAGDGEEEEAPPASSYSGASSTQQFAFEIPEVAAADVARSPDILSGSTPFVIRGIANDWPALTKWDNEYFAEVSGTMINECFAEGSTCACVFVRLRRLCGSVVPTLPTKPGRPDARR
jgi:hypothetical protein